MYGSSDLEQYHPVCLDASNDHVHVAGHDAIGVDFKPFVMSAESPTHDESVLYSLQIKTSIQLTTAKLMKG